MSQFDLPDGCVLVDAPKNMTYNDPDTREARILTTKATFTIDDIPEVWALHRSITYSKQWTVSHLETGFKVPIISQPTQRFAMLTAVDFLRGQKEALPDCIAQARRRKEDLPKLSQEPTHRKVS